MGKLWYVYEGASTQDLRCELSFAKAQELFKDKISYHGAEPPLFPSSKPALAGYKDPKRLHVVFELPAREATGFTPDEIGFQPATRYGFYLIHVNSEQCEAILRQEML